MASKYELPMLLIAIIYLLGTVFIWYGKLNGRMGNFCNGESTHAAFLPQQSLYLEPLNQYKIDTFLDPIYNGGCCGIGHRMSRNVPTIVYALTHGRKAKISWHDVPRSAIFNDTYFVQSILGDDEGYIDAQTNLDAQTNPPFLDNNFPPDWCGLEDLKHVRTQSSYDKYNKDYFHCSLTAPVLVMMQNALSPLVLSYLDSIRTQLNIAKNKNHHLNLCTHVRQGNNETGHWEDHKWRHVDLGTVLNNTLLAMENFAQSRKATKVSIFAASDNTVVRPWFDRNSPSNWNTIYPGKSMPKPENGVWFGEWNSTTGNILNQTMKNEAMAEATAELFALGECDALFIPNYSSFTYPAIALTRAREKAVFFAKRPKRRNCNDLSFVEMDSFEEFRKRKGGDIMVLQNADQMQG